MRKAFFGAGNISTLALGSSYFVEFGLHYQPCFLCLIQRALYFLLFLAALTGILTPFKSWSKRICLILLALNFSTASYHTLVQLKIVKDRCKSPGNVENVNSYREILAAKKKPGCSEDLWEIASVPVPALNALVSLSFFCFIWRRRN